MPEPVWTDPLAHRQLPANCALMLDVETRNAGVLDLRIAAGDTKGRKALASAIGLDLPTKPRTSASQGDVAALWMSIDQWLIVTPRDRIEALKTTAENAGSDQHFALTDVSDMRAILRISGDALRNVLAKCMPVDVFAEEFAPGFVRRVTFGEIAAAMHIVSDAPWTADLYVFRSYADYALSWIEDTARPGADPDLFVTQKPAMV